jgi:4-carboxymuconolactone decarboxylase
MTDSRPERFRQLTLEELDDEQRRAIEPILAFAGGIVGPFNATLRSPEITARSFHLGEHLLFETTLPRRLVEMAVLIRARFSFSQVEWYAHRRSAAEAGLDDAICDALREGRRPASMDEDEDALFDLCVELLRGPAVSDATFERARAALGERGVVELAYLIGFYGMISLVLKLAEVEAPDGSTPLEPIADPFGRAR